MTRHRQAGVAAVELALLLIPLLVLVFGMTELGRALYTYNTAVAATRDGARFLSTTPPHENEAQARCLVVYGQATESCTGTPLVSGLKPSMVEFAYESVPTGPGLSSIDVVTVRIAGLPFAPLVPFTVTEEFTMSAIETTMRQGAT